MTPDQHSQFSQVFFNTVMAVIPVFGTLLIGVCGFLLSKVQSLQRAHDLTQQKVEDISNGKGMEKMTAVIVKQVNEGKLLPGPTPQAEVPIIEPDQTGHGQNFLGGSL